MEFKSNWLNNDDSLNIELFYNDELRLIRKSNEIMAKEIINFYYHSKYTVAYSKPSYRDITSFSFNYADFPPLSSKSSAVKSFNSLQSSKLSSNSNFSTFTQKSFAESVLRSNNFLFPLGATPTQNSCFSLSAHKYSVASASVKNVSSSTLCLWKKKVSYIVITNIQAFAFKVPLQCSSWASRNGAVQIFLLTPNRNMFAGKFVR